MTGLKSILGKLRDRIITLFWNGINRFSIFSGGIKTGKGFRSWGRIRVRNRGKITVGDRVIINSSIMANPIGGNPCTILVATKGARITVGNGSGLSNAAVFARESVTIGDNVFIGAGTCIYDNDFHPLDFEGRMRNDTPVSKPVVIADGAFIGAHSIVLKGVSIGKHSIIGAGSVVTKSVPDGEIWAGNPAKPIRKLEEKG